MRVIAVGANHKSAPIGKRERIAFPFEDIPHALETVGGYDSVQEAVILSTCGRVEIYAVTDDLRRARRDLTNFIGTYHGVDVGEVGRILCSYEQESAVSHLFSVASGLDSMVLGENQIVHQLKRAYFAAKGRELAGKGLNALFQRAFKVAKQVRADTWIARKPVSVSSVAVELATRALNGLAGKTVMIVGAGKVGELTARCLVSSGASSVIVLNRTFSKAQDLARRLSGHALPWERLREGLREADVVISSVAAPNYVIGEESLRSAMRCRNGCPIFLVDIAVPRNVEPVAASVRGVHLYNIDALQAISAGNLDLRKNELAACQGIIREQTSDFMRWLKFQEVAPVISGITDHLKHTCLREVERTMSRLGGVPDDTRKELQWLAHRISKKLSLAPISCLKRRSAHD